MKRMPSRWLCTVAVLILSVGLLNYLFPTYKQREKEYYSSRENYTMVTGTVSNVIYSNNGQVFVYICDKSVDFTDTGFILDGDNARIAKENGIQTKLQTGTVVEFVCAPRYFGDGYKIPMVALCIEGESILDFETGFYNLNAEYDTRLPLTD